VELKKRVLFIGMHRPGRSPSQRFRFEQYIEYLSENGIKSHFSYLIDEKDDKLLYQSGHLIAKGKIFIKSLLKRWSESKKLAEYDFVFIQREAMMTSQVFFEKQASKQSKLIFDFDDSIWLANQNNANRGLYWLKNPSKVNRIFKLANLVIAGNNYLATYSKKFNQHVKIIPTTLDTDYHRPQNTRKEINNITIGWTGSFSTIKYYHEKYSLLDQIRSNSKNITLSIISDGFLDTGIRAKQITWNLTSEIEDLSTFDIGIMPLPDNEWTRGKCGFKALQYMAMEIPVVASPVGVNTEIIQDGINGFLASSDEEWVEKLTLLIENPELRQKLGKAGRLTVIERYSVEANKHKYLRLFK